MTRELGLNLGEAMHSRLRALFPICRSITGNGIRQTIAHLQSEIPLRTMEIPSGSVAFDWTIPKEWNITDAWIKDPSGRKIVDFHQNNLHIVSYSVPVKASLSLNELRTHLFSLPDQPSVIPYRTTYYKEDWGFCIADELLQSLREGQYQVCVESSFTDGSLTLGEFFLPGAEEKEILISSHICHPSLANDNLSGVVVATELAKTLAARSNRKYSYRFLYMPGTIGAIAWLSRNEENLYRVKHGLILSGVGDPGNATYKRSRRGDCAMDRVMSRVLESRNAPFTIQDYSPYGYDERQYCSPGFNLPIGRFSRTPFGTYPEYHTSLDNPDFVKPWALADSYRTVLEVLDHLESDWYPENTVPKCEPQLGRRGLYRGNPDQEETMAMFWILNLADGNHSIFDISVRSKIPIDKIDAVARRLVEAGLLT